MKWLFALFSLLVIVVAGLTVGPSFFDWNQYKKPALEQVANLTGLDMAIDGDVSLAVLPSPRVYLEKVRVKDPADAQGQKNLAAFDLLDVRVGLVPLFKGQVVVNSVHLDKPEIALSKTAQGEFNFMTPKIKAMMDAKAAVSGAAKSETPQGEKFALSFESISVEGGSFSLHDPAQKQPVILKDINLDVEASSLSGPFEGEGRFVFNNMPVKFEGKTGEIDPQQLVTSLNMEASLGGLVVKYAGTVSGGKAPELQGEVSASIRSVSKFLSQQGGDAKAPKGLEGGLAVRGMVSANAQRASLKNASLQIADQALEGSVEVAMNPLTVQGAFKGQGMVNLDAFLGSGAKKAQGGAFDPGALGASLPQTLEIPVLGSSKIALSVPGVIYKGQMIKEVQITALNTEKSFAVSVNAGNAPGQGRVAADGALSFAEKSVSAKTNKAIYSGPKATFAVKGEAQNFPQMVQAFTGLTDLPLVKDTKRGVFDLNGALAPSGLSLSKGVLNLGDAAFSASGSWGAQAGSKRSLLKANVTAGALDLDALSGGQKSGGQAGGDPLAALKNLNLPFDVQIDVGVNKVAMQGHNITGARVAASIVPNQIKVSKLSVERFGDMVKPVDLATNVGWDDKGLSLSDIQGRIMDANVSGSARVETGGAKPFLGGKLQFGDLTFKKAVSGSSAAQSGAKSGQKWSSDPIDTAFLHLLNADIDVAASSIVYDTWNLSKPSLKLTLKDGVLDIKDLQAGLHDGQISSRGTVSSSGGGAPLSVKMASQITNINLGSLVKTLVGTGRIQAEGDVSLNFDVSANGVSQSALVSSLGGQANLAGKNVVMKGFNLSGLAAALMESNKPLPRVQEILRSSTSSGQTAFDTIDGAYAIQNGVVNISSMAMTGPEATIASTGNVNLPRWTIDTTHKITLANAPGVDPFDVVIKGSLDNPKNTFGAGLFDTFVRQRLQSKVVEELPDLLGEDVTNKLQKFGILPQKQAPAPVEPAAGGEGEVAQPVAPAEQPKTEDQQKQEAIEGLIKGLLR